MILLLTACPRGPECAVYLEEHLRESVRLAATLRRGTSELGNGRSHQECSLVVLDQNLADAYPADAEKLLERAGGALTLFLNFAICGPERLLREVRAALGRRHHEQLIALRAAQEMLRNELRGKVTGILISSELALSHPALPAAAASKMRSVHEMARELCTRLDGGRKIGGK